MSFIIFLLFSSRLVIRSISCLATTSAVTTNYQDCNLVFATDRFLIMGLIGLSFISAISLYLFRKENRKKVFLLITSLMITFVASYYLFMNRVSEKILNNPIYLDSLYMDK